VIFSEQVPSLRGGAEALTKSRRTSGYGVAVNLSLGGYLFSSPMPYQVLPEISHEAGCVNGQTDCQLLLSTCIDDEGDTVGHV
jgi:hypothetical protein